MSSLTAEVIQDDDSSSAAPVNGKGIPIALPTPCGRPDRRPPTGDRKALNVRQGDQLEVVSNHQGFGPGLFEGSVHVESGGALVLHGVRASAAVGSSDDDCGADLEPRIGAESTRVTVRRPRR